MALNAQFAATPNFGSALLSAADTVLTGTPTNVSVAIITGATLGTRVSKIIIKATATGTITNPNVVRLWYHDATNFRLIHEVLVPAYIQSATASAPTIVLSEATNFDFLPFMLKNTHSIRASMSQSQTITVSVFGADV